MGKSANERRRRWVYITKNTEYHTLDGVCVAVRDRSTGRWQSEHPAHGKPVAGGVQQFSNGALIATSDRPTLGAAMYFVVREGAADDEEQLVTSRLTGIDRPALADLGRYRWSGAAQP
ncbi:MAG: hypothetical protein HY908_26910 [Myxococcales bacterium]|nr:hypothetical protein [Myxococcales bacterium]